MIELKSKLKQITGMVFAALILAVLILGEKLIDIPTSIAVDNVEPKIEASLDKYVNYNLSEQDKGTLLQYSIRTGFEYKDEQAYLPAKQSEININLEKIDNKYPFAVKLITKSTQAVNGNNSNNKTNYVYDNITGKLVITTSNQDDKGNAIYTNGNKEDRDEYSVICYYDTYTVEKPQRTAKFSISAKYILITEEKAEISKNGEFSKEVSEDINSLTSMQYQTDDIYNGYIKSNVINGTEYATDYKEKTQIVISKKEAQEKIQLTENNTFVQKSNNEQGEETTQEIGNNGNLVYKSTKVFKNDIQRVLGEDGILQVTDTQGNILAEINRNTQYSEDGTYTITYGTEPEAITIKTSKVINEGQLLIENTKKIKATMVELDNLNIKTITELKGIQENKVIENNEEIVKENITYLHNNEKVNEIKDAQTSVDVKINNEEWTNEKQNEVTFDIKLNSNSIQYNLFKNPTIRIELPEEVEKVILDKSTLLYGNGLELQNVELETDERGKISIISTLVGVQTQYNINELGLETTLNIPATIILKKEIESKLENVNITFTNEYTTKETTENSSFSKNIGIIDYRDTEENNTEIIRDIPLAKNSDLESENFTQDNQPIENLHLEVQPTKGETTLKDGDVV